MDICVIGAGHVGLVTGACFADLGSKVICADNDRQKIEGLKKNRMPFYEPGLEEMVEKNTRQKRLFFTTNLKEAVKKSQVIFIAVGTPPKPGGEADLSFVENISRSIAEAMDSYKLIVEKSTVPVETGTWIKHTLRVNNKRKVKFDVASNPEFLREGSAIRDFLQPDRIVLGVESKKAKQILLQLYKPLRSPTIITDIKSAELIKHASNSFLALKVSFINAISNICEKVGADIMKVAEGIGGDKRIGKDFLSAGIGFGGFCLPKDVEAFNNISRKLGYDFKLLEEILKINQFQKELLLKKVHNSLWILKDKVISILGLSFKPNTDDMRFAPSIEIIRSLQKEGAKIRAYDPQAKKEASKILKGIKFCKDSYEAAKGGDCLIILTEWNEFKELDLKRVKGLMKQPIIIDGRNIYEPAVLKKLGFKYFGMGRK